MKFIKDNAILNVIKFSILLLIIMFGISLLPNIVRVKRDSLYQKNEIKIYEETNPELYIERIASYNSFSYKKEPLINNLVLENNDSKIILSAYAASYYQENNTGDTMQFLIKEASYKGEPFKKITIKLGYLNPIVKDPRDSSKDVYELDINSINDSSLFYSFWAGDAKNLETDKEENILTTIRLSIETKNYTLENYLVISDNADTMSSANLGVGLTENNLIRSNYDIKSKISANTNIPTSKEIEELNLVYKNFDYSLLKKYNYVYYIYYPVYTIISLAIVYFLFIHGDLMRARKIKKGSKN